MKKKLVLLLALALSLSLTGCNLVVKDKAVDMQRTVLSVNDEIVSKESFLPRYEETLARQRQFEQMLAANGITGYDMSDSEVAEQTMDTLIRRIVINQKAKEMGLTTLSEEEQKQMEEAAQSDYQTNLDTVKAQYFTGSQLPEEELEKAIKKQAVKLGITYENMAETALNSIIEDKVREEIYKDITVEDTAIQEEYDSRVHSDKTRFEQDSAAYGSDRLSGKDLYYVPAGYRLVKQVLVKFDEESQAAIDEARTAHQPFEAAVTQAQNNLDENAAAIEAAESDEKKAELEANVEALTALLENAQKEAEPTQKALDMALEKGYTAIYGKAHDIYLRAHLGTSFDKLVKEFSEDPGQPEEGYAITDNFTQFDSAFVEPAMALSAAGNVARPSKGQYGYYIVQYTGDIKEGPVNFETVKDDIHAELLKKVQDDAFTAAVQAWIDASTVEKFIDRVLE